MRSNLVTLFIVAGLILIFTGMILWQNHKNKKIMLQKIRRLYGNAPEREYESGDLEKISHYFHRKQKDFFFIDDITWNDLEMDRIYKQINQTVSSPGEDILYNMLRTPLFSKEALQERENLICFFATHQQEREKIQLLLSKVGKTRLGSLSDTILALSEAVKVNTRPHAIMAAILLADLFIVLPLAPLWGFLLFFLLSIMNVVNYYSCADRKKVEAYLDCFAGLLHMLSVADEMQVIQWPEVQKQMDAIKEGKKAFASFKKKAFFLTGSGGGVNEIIQTIMDYIRLVFHLDILMYNGILKEVQGKKDKIMLLIDNMGELDAAISIASYRELLTLKCTPQFIPYNGDAVTMEVEDLYHPLISEAVANSISVKVGTLITGSNASGKSTFLKNIAINSIFAQTINVCTCAFYKAPFLKVMTSMALRDDLSQGESYFIVEIKSLKRILDESEKEEPLLCVIDEVLRGTNTIERIAASSRILASLDRRWVLPFAATHDIELSYILAKIYTNYHFEERIQDHQVIFDYILHEGRAVTRNAIRLLEMLDYDTSLVKSAGDAAEDFEKNGVWSALGNSKL